RGTENQPTGHGPMGWLEKGPSASLFVRYVSHRICSSLTPRIQTLLKPTVCLLLVIRRTRASEGRFRPWRSPGKRKKKGLALKARQQDDQIAKDPPRVSRPSHGLPSFGGLGEA